MKIGILVGSNRKLSNSIGLAQWVQHHLSSVAEECQIFTPTNEILTAQTNFIPPMAIKTVEGYESQVIQKYSRDISSCDGFIFISPVYNHSYTGQFKIMMDHLFHEFANKPVLVIAQGPSAAQTALDGMVGLAKKYSMNVIGGTSIKIPYEYVSTSQRISHDFNPEAKIDEFLKDHETDLVSNLTSLLAAISN